MRSARRLLVCAVVSIVLGCVTGWSQVTTATLYGIVQDPTGALIPGAQVVLTNEGTGGVLSTTSDARGEFGFSVLPVGTYSLRIEAAGFKTFQNRGMGLSASQVVRQSYALELGEVSEVVSVEGSAPLIETAAAEQRENLTQTQVHELPLSRRNVTSVLKLSSGVDTGLGSVRINGQGKSGAVITVDGTDANSNPSEGRAMAQYGERNYIDVLSIDAVQEVQLMRGVMPAEIGGVISGQVNMITKSGTNEFHGSLFENYRSHIFNARDPFQSSVDASGKRISKNREVFNQFGGTAGGPIIRDRAFIFGAYEGYRESRFARLTGNVPTDDLRAEILQALPFAETKMLMDILPHPTLILDPVAGRGRFEGAGGRSSTENHVLLKGDVRVTQLSNLAVTYSRNRPFGLDPNYVAANDRTYDYAQDRLAAQYTVGSSQWVSETRFGWNKADMERLDGYFGFIDPDQDESVLYQRRIPRLVLGFTDTYGSAEIWQMKGTTYSIDQKVSRHMGKHTFKFGVRYLLLDGERTNPENPSYRFNTRSQISANLPDTLSITFGSGGPHRHRMWEIGGFVQDEWRVNSRLVLNLGVRYDFYSNNSTKALSDVPVVDKNLEPPTNWPAFNFGAVRSFDSPTENDGWVNLGPRAGFAYKVDDEGKTTVRGGVGIIFAGHVPAILRQSTSHPVVPFRVNWSQSEAAALGVKWPMTNEEILPIAIQSVESAGRELVFSLWDPNLQNPYSINYQLNIQRQLATDLMWEVGFVGTRGVKFPMHRRFNLPDRATGVRPNPSLIPGGFYVDNSENTQYMSLQSSVRKRFSRNFSFDLHYTWGKSFSYAGGDVGVYYGTDAIEASVQDFFNLGIERGHAAYDTTHRVVGDWIYQLPRLTNMSAPLRGILGGWEVTGILSARTGTPLRVTQGCSDAYVCRADYIGGNTVLDNWQDQQVPTTRIAVHQDVQYLNKAAFAAVPETLDHAIRPGTAGTSLVRGPGAWDVDVSLSKNFDVREGMRLQLRADMFNALNHINLNGPATRVDQGNFGQISGAAAMRSMQVGARLTF